MHFNYKKIIFTQGNSYNVCISTIFIRAINARQNSVKRRSRIGKTDGIGELARAYRDCYDDSRQQEGRMRVAAALPRIAWGSCLNGDKKHDVSGCGRFDGSLCSCTLPLRPKVDPDLGLDHVTIFDFTKMLGDVGIAQINHSILSKAQILGIMNPSQLMSDTTAQEAKIPYPTETGLMMRFGQLVQKAVSGLGGKFRDIKDNVKEKVQEIKELVRNSHLFAKGKEQKGKVGRKIYHTVKELHASLAEILATGSKLTSKGGKDLTALVSLMDRLLPQIIFFLKTGFVAHKKIIHLQMSELYSIVRGKAGKKVEFGLKWGISRLGGGFLQGFLLAGGQHAADQKFCLEALNQHQKIFGKAPTTFGFDRGGYSASNIKKAKKLGVINVGIAPTGKTPWVVSETLRKSIVRERAQVEGGIGTIKSSRYGFNKPNAKSTAAMARCGQRAILGFNMRKLTREWSSMQSAAAMS